MPTAVEFNHIGKQYRLGLVSTGTLSHDLNRWWQTTVLRREDPYLKIGSVNDRTKAADSDYVWALRDIDFKVEQGDVVGIIGKNGAGKSTLLKLLSKVTAPTVGTIRARGRIASLLEVGTGFHGEMTGRENIYLNGAIMGMTRDEITRKLDEIVDFSGCERYLDTPVKRYSSGMTVRLGFAVAAHLEPEILVVDEVLAVGDAEFQKKAIGKMQSISHSHGRTVLFVSHNMGAVKTLCNKGLLLDKGEIAFSGSVEDTITQYIGLSEDSYIKDICERTDRIGNGKIKVTNISLQDREGKEVEEIFAGDYLKIKFHVETNGDVDFDKMIIGCKLEDIYGHPCVMWASDEMAHDFSTIRDGVFSLEIPHVNMRPNDYFIHYQISLNSTSPKDFCDVMHAAKRIRVLSDCFYSPGVLLKEGRDLAPLINGTFISE